MKSFENVSRASTPLPDLRLARYLPVLYMLGFAMMLAWTSAAGLFSPLSGWLYDRLVRAVPQRPIADSAVLAVEIGTERIDAAALRQALESIAALGARLVAVNFLPQGADWVPAAKPGADLVVGVRFRYDSVTGEVVGLQQPDATTVTALPLAVSVMPVIELGISRRARVEREIGGRAVPTFEAAVVRGMSGAPPTASRPFLVDFRDGGHRVPVVGLERVLRGGLVKTMVEGKAVILGFVQDVTEPGLNTPLTGTGRTTSLLRFQAQAIDTLLRDAVVREPGFVFQALLYTLILALSLYAYQKLRLRMALTATGVSIGVYLIAGWVVLGYARAVLPVFEMAVMQAAAFLVVFVKRMTRGELVLHRALIDTSSRMRERIIPSSFYSSAEPWVYVANLLSQTLELRRMIFLEKIAGDHRVREVHALHCSLNDIDERRRDYQRTPYSTAIAAAAPIRLSKIYLNDDGSGEHQYLVCLSFAGEIIGFWAFGVLPENVPDESNFSNLVGDFAEQVAEMLYHRQRWIEEQQVQKLPFLQFLQIEGWAGTHKAFQQSLALFDKRLTTLEHVFNGMGTAAVLYDLFGRVVHVNKRMEELLKRAQLPFFALTSVELVTALAGRDAETVRRYLHYVVIERAVIALPAPLLDDGLHAYLLLLRPLEHEAAVVVAEDLAGDAAPFRLSGVLIEAQDITLFKTLNELQENLLNRLDLRLRNDLESLLIGADLLPDDGAAGGPSLKQLLQAKVRTTVESFEEVYKHLNFTLDIHEIETYPVEYRPALARALAEVEGQVARRRVAVRVDEPHFSPLVIAGPEALREVFATLLRVVIEDAIEGSDIDVCVTTDKQFVQFGFSNRGFGIPDERLQGYLRGDSTSSIDEFRRVRGAARSVDHWGGALEATSVVGEGIRFELRLKGFM